PPMSFPRVLSGIQTVGHHFGCTMEVLGHDSWRPGACLSGFRAQSARGREENPAPRRLTCLTFSSRTAATLYSPVLLTGSKAFTVSSLVGVSRKWKLIQIMPGCTLSVSSTLV